MALPYGIDVSSESGPYWIPQHQWWKNPDHKRSVVAFLVEGAYFIEKDRKATEKDLTGSAALTPPRSALTRPRWEYFGFHLPKRITDKRGSHIGAIYQYTNPTLSPYDPEAPAYVVAFRGTILEGGNIVSDMIYNLNLVIDRLHRRSRSEVAVVSVLEVLDQTHWDYNRVWLAGHSLGASMAMLVGKHLAWNIGVYLNDTFLFNPPFISLPIGLVIKNKDYSRLIRVVNNTIVDFTSFKRQDNLSTDRFQALSRWCPHLFVHPKDPICLGYIDYFKKEKCKEEMRIRGADGVVGGHSLLRHLMDKTMGKEPLHLIPSANLTVNNSKSYLINAHKLSQWWKPNLPLEWSHYCVNP